LPLLAYLLLHRAVPLGRDFLAYLLWPDDAEESARTKLRANLYDLARVLPPPAGHWLLIDGDHVQWNPAATLWLDVDAFLEAAADPARQEEAVDLYAGDLVEALYDEWVFPIRERLRNLYLASLTQAISSARRRLDFPRAIELAQRLLGSEPFREDIVRRLIALRSDSGDRAGALNEYRRFHDFLRAELGIDPMPETVAVRDAIAHGDSPAEAAEAEDASPAAEQSPALPFVGRHAELEQLLDAWSRAARGRGGLVFVGGEAGIGKTRLALELIHAVEERGGRVLLGSTGSPEAIPYQSIVVALRSALPLVESLRVGDVWLATLATLLPEVRRVVTLPPPRVDPANERARLFEALARALAALAKARPVLLVLEDLHWAQEATIAALAFLQRRVALAPVLIVATYRDDEAPRLHPLQRLRRDSVVHGARSLLLRPLTLDDVAELESFIATRTGRTAQALHAESDGNPLFLTQLLEGETSEDDAGPIGLRALVARRIERLSPAARTVAEIAALIGAQFSAALAREVCGWDEAAVADALGELIDRRIVRETAGRGLFDYTFGHEVVREAVIDAVPPGRAPERHRRIALVLDEFAAERGDELAGEVARHFELAGDGAAAARHYLVASRRSMSVGALDAARAQLERVLVLAADPRERIAALLEFDRLMARTGDRAARESALGQLETLTESLGDEELRRQALLCRVQFAQLFEGEAAHVAALDRLRTLVRDDMPAWRGIVDLEESSIAHARGDLERSYGAAEAALGAYREIGDEAGAARSLFRMAEVEMVRSLDRAGKLLAEASATAERAREGAVELDSHRVSFFLAYNKRDLDQSLASAERWLERGVALGDRSAEAGARMRVAMALSARRERIPEAGEHFDFAEAFFIEVDDRRGRGSVLLNRALFHAMLCRFPEARESTERAIAVFDAMRDARGVIIGRGNLSLMLAFCGDPRRGAEEARAALEMARSHDYGFGVAAILENLAKNEEMLGELDAAIEHGEAALRSRVESESEMWAGQARADLAVRYAARGELATARSLVDLMLADEGFERGAEWPQACFWGAARVLRAAGDAARARRCLERAQELVVTLAAELEPKERDRYLAVPWHRAIADAAERDVWPELVFTANV